MSSLENDGERVLRVSRLDATEIDDELSELFQRQLLEVLRPLPPGLFLVRIKPELKALVRLLLWGYSVARNGTTFGQSMLDLVYRTSTSQPLKVPHKIVLLVFSVAADWVAERSEDVLPPLFPTHTKRTLTIIKIVSAVLKMLSLVNFLSFLLHGHYPSLKERVGSLKMVPSRPQTLRQLNYDYMNREILWYGFSEFIFFVLPHLNLFALKNWIKRHIGSRRRGHLEPIDFTKCSFCEKELTMPHITNECGHVYCYYCISANCLVDNQYPCSVCGAVVNGYCPVQL